ncbi:MAG TPA: hypothetical protein PLR64_03670 [Candidatus Dojkabacteria bacterium]|nr:hypothetical protein [Candidatus Dojkabacteria bacterium]
MKVEEIAQTAKEFVELQNRLNVIRTPQHYFRSGAEMVNEKQPYSREDMIAFLSWVQYNGFIYNSDSGVWISESMEFSGCAYSDDELLKLWEETK